MEEEKTEKISEEKHQDHSDHMHYHDHDHWHGPRLAKIVLLIVGIVLIFGVVASLHHRSLARRNVFISGGEFRSGMYDGPRMHGGGFGGQRGMKGGHSGMRNTITGSITVISGNTITVKTTTQDVTVTIADTTSIYTDTKIAAQSDLKVGSNVVVNGLPGSNGAVAARVIRITS